MSDLLSVHSVNIIRDERIFVNGTARKKKEEIYNDISCNIQPASEGEALEVQPEKDEKISVYKIYTRFELKKNDRVEWTEEGKNFRVLKRHPYKFGLKLDHVKGLMREL